MSSNVTITLTPEQAATALAAVQSVVECHDFYEDFAAATGRRVYQDDMCTVHDLLTDAVRRSTTGEPQPRVLQCGDRIVDPYSGLVVEVHSTVDGDYLCGAWYKGREDIAIERPATGWQWADGVRLGKRLVAIKDL